MSGLAVAYVRRADLRRRLALGPELVAGVVIAGAWLVLIVVSFRGLGPFSGSPSTPQMPGMYMPPGPGRSLPSTIVAGMPLWIVMCVAMMGPSALAGVRHTGLNSLAWRKKRAVLEYSAGYVTVWASFGVLVLVLGALVPTDGHWFAVGIALAIAGLWQFSVFKRRALRDCHRATSLPLWGKKAELASLDFGLNNGSACLRSCWCLMVVMSLAPGSMVLWMTGLGMVITVERLVERPRRVTRAIGVVCWLSLAIVIVVASL